jgi:hypothetical protein
MQTSETINEIAAAGAKAQAEMKAALKERKNEAFKGSKYADLSAVMEAAKPYAHHGISIWQDALVTDAGVSVTTHLFHTSGQWMQFGPFVMPFKQRDAYGVGSATTYAKRYSLCAALAISADDDDDGAGADNGSTSKPASFDPPVAPEGFAKFATDLGLAASQGTPALREAWRAGTDAQRGHLEAVKPGMFETLKKQAAAVVTKTASTKGEAA